MERSFNKMKPIKTSNATSDYEESIERELSKVGLKFIRQVRPKEHRKLKAKKDIIKPVNDTNKMQFTKI